MMNIDNSSLEEIARKHVAQELRVLIGQLTHPALQGRDEILRVSLIEASLEHIRLFDDFFRLKATRDPRRCQSCGAPLVCKTCEKPQLPPADDVTAQHYLPTWSPRPILSAKLRGDLNAQLPHLAARRKAGYMWDLGSLGIKVCVTFIDFVDELQASDSGRAEWLADAYQRVVTALPLDAELAAMAVPEVEPLSLSVDTSPPRMLSASMPTTTTSPESKVTVSQALPLQPPRSGPRAEK